MSWRTAVLALACAAACPADTLTLRTGQVVQGTYMGGTARTVKMQVDDAVKTYDVTDIATLQFTPPAAAASAGPPAGHAHPGTSGASTEAARGSAGTYMKPAPALMFVEWASSRKSQLWMGWRTVPCAW